MPKYHVAKRKNDGSTEEWDIEALNYTDAHFKVLIDEGYHIELAPEEKKEIKIGEQKNENS